MAGCMFWGFQVLIVVAVCHFILIKVLMRTLKLDQVPASLAFPRWEIARHIYTVLVLTHITNGGVMQPITFLCLPFPPQLSGGLECNCPFKCHGHHAHARS